MNTSRRRTMANLRNVATLGLVAMVATATAEAAPEAADARPNIVWIFVDDMSANFSCYGETRIETPNVDRLAREGVKFTRAFVTAPVCSPCRSALITGMYQTSIGAHHHRSGRGSESIHLPGDVVPVPVLFKEAGYYTCNGTPNAKGKALGKTDYNFEWDPAMYDGNDWSGRAPGQPFFMQFQAHGGKHRGGGNDPKWEQTVRRELGSITDPDSVALPPYYPRDPVLLRDWAQYLDTCRYTDKEVGEIVARLKEEGILDSTYVFFMTDHGISHARGKQFLYDEGIHVPFVIRGPGIEAGAVRDDLVEHIDMTATSLALAGIGVPGWMQARDILASDYVPRDAVVAARDRCDETVDHIRSVRTERFKYIRNYLHDRPHLQPNVYKDNKPIVRRIRELHASGNLDPLAERLLFAPSRAPEELYDLVADPFELTNLAGNPDHRQTLQALRTRLSDWESWSADRGRLPEPASMYDSDMALYLNGRGAKSDGLDEIVRNIDQMKAWAAEGK